jgi:hypothetical protein
MLACTMFLKRFLPNSKLLPNGEILSYFQKSRLVKNLMFLWVFSSPIFLALF